MFQGFMLRDTHSVFGAPTAADKRQLVIVLAGEYKIKKEIAYLVVPAMGRKVRLLVVAPVPSSDLKFKDH